MDSQKDVSDRIHAVLQFLAWTREDLARAVAILRSSPDDLNKAELLLKSHQRRNSNGVVVYDFDILSAQRSQIYNLSRSKLSPKVQQTLHLVSKAFFLHCRIVGIEVIPMGLDRVAVGSLDALQGFILGSVNVLQPAATRRSIDTTRWWNQALRAIAGKDTGSLEKCVSEAVSATPSALLALMRASGSLEPLLLPYYSKWDSQFGVGMNLMRLIDKGLAVSQVHDDPSLHAEMLGVAIPYWYRYGTLHERKAEIQGLASLEAGLTDRSAAIKAGALRREYVQLITTGETAIEAANDSVDFIHSISQRMSCDSTTASFHCAACTALREGRVCEAGQFLDRAKKDLTDLGAKLPDAVIHKRRAYICAIEGKLIVKSLGDRFRTSDCEAAIRSLKTAISNFYLVPLATDGFIHLLACAYCEYLIANLYFLQGDTPTAAVFLQSASAKISACEYTYCCLFDGDREVMQRNIDKLGAKLNWVPASIPSMGRILSNLG